MAINALILAAGFGTRLRPLTLHTPKCLVEIAGLPLLEYWLQKLEKVGCKTVVINTHHLHEQIEEYIKKRSSNLLEIICTYEQELLGTARTLLENKCYFKQGTNLLLHGDNATDVKLENFLRAHKSRPAECSLSMMTFTSNEPEKCGIVEVNKNGIVQELHEKVSNPPNNQANAAIYAFDPDFVSRLESKEKQYKDFSLDVLPRFVGEIYAWPCNARVIDIGTPQNLEMARKLWSNVDMNKS